MDNPIVECGALIRIQVMTSQLTAHHLTDGMDEVSMIKIFEPILIQIMGVGAKEEIMSQGVLNTVFIASVLQDGQDTWNVQHRGLTRYPS